MNALNLRSLAWVTEAVLHLRYLIVVDSKGRRARSAWRTAVKRKKPGVRGSGNVKIDSAITRVGKDGTSF